MRRSSCPGLNRISNSLIEPRRRFHIHSCHLMLEGTQPRRQAPGREGGQINIYLSKWNRTITIPMDAIDIGPTITRINGISGVLFFFTLKPWNWITRIAAIFPTNTEEFPPVNLVSFKVPPRVALSDLKLFCASPMLAALSNIASKQRTIQLAKFVDTDVRTFKCVWSALAYDRHFQTSLYTDVSSESLPVSLTFVVFCS